MNIIITLSILLALTYSCSAYQQHELEVKFMTEFGPAMLNKTYDYYRYFTTNELFQSKTITLTVPDQSYSLPDFSDAEIDVLPMDKPDWRWQCSNNTYIFPGNDKCMTKSQSFLTIDPCACIWNDYHGYCNTYDQLQCYQHPSATYGFYTMILEAEVPYNNTYLQIYNKCDSTDDGYQKKISLNAGKNKLYVNNKTHIIGRVGSILSSGNCEIIAKTNSDDLKLIMHTYSMGYLYIGTSLNENNSFCVIFKDCYKLLS